MVKDPPDIRILAPTQRIVGIFLSKMAAFRLGECDFDSDLQFPDLLRTIALFIFRFLSS